MDPVLKATPTSPQTKQNTEAGRDSLCFVLLMIAVLLLTVEDWAGCFNALRILFEELK